MQSKGDSLPGEVKNAMGRYSSFWSPFWGHTNCLCLSGQRQIYPLQWPDCAVLTHPLPLSEMRSACLSHPIFWASQALPLSEGNPGSGCIFLFLSFAQQQVGNGTFVHSWLYRWRPWWVCGNTSTRAPCGWPSPHSTEQSPGGATGISELPLPRLATDFALFWKILDKSALLKSKCIASLWPDLLHCLMASYSSS